VQKQGAPRPPALKDVKWFVVTENNFEALKAKFAKDGKALAAYGLTPADFKALLANQSELLRYIKQQQAIIVYYEKNTD
jgi:hypothetical protein